MHPNMHPQMHAPRHEAMAPMGEHHRLPPADTDGVSAQAAKPEPYRASSQVARNWASLTGVVSVGRIHKIETYERYESMAPCTISEEVCKALEGKLEIARAARKFEIIDGSTYPIWIMRITTDPPLASTVGRRALTEFTFQVASRIDGSVARGEG